MDCLKKFFLAQIAKVIKNTKGESKGSGKGKGGALSWLDVQGLAMLGLFLRFLHQNFLTLVEIENKLIQVGFEPVHRYVALHLIQLFKKGGCQYVSPQKE